MRRTFASLATLSLFLSFPSFAQNTDQNAPRSTYMTASQKAVAEKLTSIWENDTPELQYGYSENIGDDRGYTSGRAGFCTGTGDAILVVRCFDKRQGENNRLHKYMMELKRLNAIFESNWETVGDVSGLDRLGNFPQDWTASDREPKTRKNFRACQDEVVDQLYYIPAMEGAERFGLSYPLSKAVFYDTYINHGEDGALEIADFVQKKLGNASPQSEESWLGLFLGKRKEILQADPVWAEAVGRVENYQALLRNGNLNLDRSFQTLSTSSGYTEYLIKP